MRKILLMLCLLVSSTQYTSAQTQLKAGKWLASLKREDGHNIPIQLLVETKNAKQAIYIVNGSEKLKTDAPVVEGDSIIIRMPVFESWFKFKLSGNNKLNGKWVKGGSVKDIVVPFHAQAVASTNSTVEKPASKNLTGKWDIQFTKPDQTKRPAIGNLTQKGNLLSGSVLTPTGDYRFMAGVVEGNSLTLSTFDGVHALLFEGKIAADTISGNFYSSVSPVESWTAVKDEKVKLDAPVTTIKEGSDGKLAFSYLDLEGKEVSLQSDRYKNKVVIIQLMGSWCPNCMDEMAFLSDYYRKNKSRGVEVIALAYELSTDKERSRKSLQRFQKQFNVEYPILNTGVTVGDKQRTEKTLPQLSEIKVFPTSLILDKKGVIKEINTSFYGPGTGEYFLTYKANLESTINKLIAEK
ncbi:MAG: TlpA disulfide reductase family protein [Pedobacter sp.]